jgi:hypothetical protein
MFGAKPRGNLDRIVAELVNELGDSRVGKLDSEDTWDLAARSRMISFYEKTQKRGVLLPVEPTHWTPHVAHEPCESIRYLLRLEQNAWWKSKSSTSASRPCDIVLAWHADRLCVVRREAGRVQIVGMVD